MKKNTVKDREFTNRYYPFLHEDFASASVLFMVNGTDYKLEKEWGDLSKSLFALMFKR
ncbi:MAG: hypothetical protein P4L49_00185 [Desulfosporosinus sp.]|nr:hypothetical protein [Desulfosporosinus sp.]